VECGSILLTLKQGEIESLKDFMTHFNQEKLLVDDQDERVIRAALLNGIWQRSSFMEDLR
jgi:hypothetical protein